MSPEALRSLARVHGIASWAATAALLAAAWVFSSGRAPQLRRVVSGVAVVLVLAAAGLGVALHDPYRARLRQRLFLSSPALGWLFERKQHFAFAAVLLALGALAVVVRLDRGPAGVPGARDLRRAALLAWAASAALALAASIASVIVAGRARF